MGTLTADRLVQYEIALQLARLVEALHDLTSQLIARQDLDDWELRERFGCSLSEIQTEAKRK
ncbi:MAG: hypothetical protein K6W08_07410 [Firmicutes bacterium]|nr:hypothetical protein [Bacillota bacterium]